ncbi:LacI family DNA-binding transcriptional regulator [Agreia sp. COWG]|uniref:LacI family DNA-binding transcriptional regulator n=1 Tax=Agreia sp. COWG TaxID=2773266 RepID=UPI001928C407|nr:substrate-binding domain-containing protein [Agreia sp. COWG]
MAASDQHTRRPTLADVARAAGVSVSTASIAFSGSGPVSEATREKVHAAAAQLGYDGPDPRARSLRQGRSGVVGVVLEGSLLYAFRDPVTSITLDGVATALGPLGAGLLLLTDSGVHEAGAGAASVETAAVDAVILLGCSTRVDHSIEVFKRRDIPVVSVEGPSRPELVEVTLDNRSASVVAARHLSSLGHSRVAVVTLATGDGHAAGPVTDDIDISVPVTRERLLGTREVYPDAPAHSAVHNTPEDGRRAALALLEAPASSRPTAIIVQADLLAVGVIQAVEELGLVVGADVSVIGFDGIRIDGLAHDLTTMVQPASAKGHAAGAAVTALLAGERPSTPIAFTCELHVGTTTGPAPADADSAQ